MSPAGVAEEGAPEPSLSRPPVAASVVICTRDRAARLRACLESVAAIESSSTWEVVVVDNGSQDETQALLEELSAGFPVPLVNVVEPVPGVARARNRGWQEAAGEVVVYTDDDCYPASDLLDRVLRHLHNDPGLGFVAGAVRLYDPEDDTLTSVTREARWEIRPGMFVTPGVVITANLSLRRHVLEEIGGLDEVFSYGETGPGGSDVDLVARAVAEGWRGLYDPEIEVRHHHGRKPGSDVERVKRSYDIGRGVFYAKMAFDRRLRRTYLAGWLVLTWGRVRRRESLVPFLRELQGALYYLRLRLLGRLPAPATRGSGDS